MKIASDIREYAERRTTEVMDRGAYVVLKHRRGGGKGSITIFVPKSLERREKPCKITR